MRFHYPREPLSDGEVRRVHGLPTALELRLPGQARATRDVDIDWAASLDEATNALVEAAALTLDDYFEFDIQRVGDADVGGAGGVRFHADAYIGGRLSSSRSSLTSASAASPSRQPTS